MARKSKQQRLEEVHREAVDRFQVLQDKEQDQRSLAIEDAKFANSEDGQWEDGAKEKRQDRPRYTINRVAPAIAQVEGDQRQNRISIKVRPASGDADKEVADIYNGLIRNIESESQAGNSYDNAFSEAVTGGYGGWRLVTEFKGDDSFDKDIRILPIQSAASSLYFGPAEKYDKRDAHFAFYTVLMPKEEYKAAWPNALETSFSENEYTENNCWYMDNMVRIAEYWVKRPINKKIAQLSDGRVIDLDEEKDVIDELELQGITVVKTRTVKSFKVEMYILNGNEVLKGPMQWSGKYIPLIPMFGRVTNIEGKEFVRGITRFSKDACRIYNYTTSAQLEAVALAPKDPYFLTTKMVGDYKSQFENFNQKNPPFMFYEPDDKHGGPPTRAGAPSVPQALLTLGQAAAQDIHATTGIEPASLGNTPELKSGKAIVAQQKMGDRGSFIYSDNLQKSIRYTAEILVDLLPRELDTEQIVRTLGVDGTEKIVTINEGAFDEFNDPIIDAQTGKKVIVNDLSRGRYDVVSSTGPATATQRAEAVNQLSELVAAMPQLGAISADIILKNMDIQDADELVTRVRKQLIQEGIATPTEDEIKEFGLDQEQEPSPDQVALVENIQSQTALNAANIQNKQADTQNKIVKSEQAKSDINKQNIDGLKVLVDSVLDKLSQGIPVSPEERDLLQNQRALIDDSQLDVAELQT